MLNISKQRINERLKTERYRSFGLLGNPFIGPKVKRNFIIAGVLSLVILFLPWTQNIQAKGTVTMLQPGQRASEIQSAIAGQIAQWYAQEGDVVNAGDTIARLREIKNEYLDPQLIERTKEQIVAKEDGVKSYEQKVEALVSLIESLRINQQVKAQSLQYDLAAAKAQAESDSAQFIAESQNLEVAKTQVLRFNQLLEQGLKSRTEVEQYRMKLAQSQAKSQETAQKWEMSKNKLLDVRLALKNNTNAFLEKIAKAQSDLATASSMLATSQGDLSKLRNTLSNYEMRNAYYYITAPQNGMLAKITKRGIGETVKEGTSLGTIVPTLYDLAVELYISPIDMPLIHEGSTVQFQFDGWPAIVFRGWPNTSYGTFTGSVVALDRITNENGKYRLLVAPSEEWPENLRAGTGARGIALLNTVPVWYEMWRQLNAFPPDYYEPILTQESISKPKSLVGQ